MINYHAEGTLVACVPADLEHTWIVWVERGDEWVVSRYQDGSPEWMQGHYFPDYNEARAHFITETLGTLPTTHMHKPRRLPMLVAQLHKFLTKLEGVGV